MSRTYTYENVLNLVSRNFPRMVESDSAASICNVAMIEIIKRYDWREFIDILPPFYLVPNQQDHGQNSVPANFLGLRSAYLVRLSADPVAFRRPIKCIKDLELTSARGLTTDIGYSSATCCFRLFPRVPENIGAPEWCIQGEYKFRPVKMTSALMSSTLVPFDDIYLTTMVEAFKWAGWMLAGDPRAGGVQMNTQGGSVFTGQYATFMTALDQMAANEGLELGDVVIAPAEALAITSRNFGGTWDRLFGP